MKNEKSSLRKKADEVKKFRCKNVIAVLENPKDIINIGNIIRTVNVLGAEKTYIIDETKKIPRDWEALRKKTPYLKKSASAIKWSFVKVFDDTQSCIEHLEKKKFVSYVTSPHLKDKENIVLHKGNYTDNKRIAIWFGNESKGISDFALRNSIKCINIPMYGIVESLNLATTAGIVLYEVTKQRREYDKNYNRRGKARRAILK